MAHRKRKRTVGDVISTILMIVAFCVFVFAAYTLYGFYKEYKKGSDEYNSLSDKYAHIEGTDSGNGNGSGGSEESEEYENYEELEVDDPKQRISGREVRLVNWNGEDQMLPTMRNPIDFEGLQAQNSDLVGWISMRAIDVSYPVMQAADNEFYLHQTFEKEYNFAGCIFLNCDNDSDFSDQNSIVYGHNMKNGSMFGRIKDYQDEKIFNKSKFFWIYTKDLIFQYRIFSVCVVDSSGLAYQTFYTDDKLQELLNYAYSHSEVDTSGVDVSSEDHIVTLSTCTGDSATRRVAFGKLVQVYASK